jgi:hypothetical protein
MFSLFRRQPSFSDLRYEALTLAQDMPGHVMAQVSYNDGTTEELPYAEEAINEIEDAMADALDGRITQRKARKIIGAEIGMMRDAIKRAGGSND